MIIVLSAGVAFISVAYFEKKGYKINEKLLEGIVKIGLFLAFGYIILNIPSP